MFRHVQLCSEHETRGERDEKRGFAFTTFIGLAGGIGCVVFSIAESGNLSLFINIPSFLIIVGGTACMLIMSFPFSVLKTLGKVINKFIKELNGQFKSAGLEGQVSVKRNGGNLVVIRLMDSVLFDRGKADIKEEVKTGAGKHRRYSFEI